MRLFFKVLSIAYISAIFFWVDSPVVSYLGDFNPYSLLHIPLYGILTVLIILSREPLKWQPNFRLLVPGIIAFVVGIADEIHQSFFPTRYASVSDIFLDFIGIILALFLIFRLYKRRKTRDRLNHVCT